MIIKNTNIQSKIELILILFCFIFSFTVIGPITSSLFIAIYCFRVYKTSYSRILNEILTTPYSKKMFKIMGLLFIMSLFYPLIHLSLDYYFTKIILLLITQFLLGIIVWSYICFKKICPNSNTLYSAIAVAFVIQSVIQCVVSFTPSLLPLIYHFNNAQAINESYSQLFGSGVRGVAMANGTGFSLSLAYGIAFITFIKYILNKGGNWVGVLIGFLLIVGIFFAGRSGFLGVGIGLLYYYLSPQGPSFMVKIGNFFKILLGVVLILLIVYVCLPDFSNHIIKNVLPFAFEPIYNLINNNSFESASTNDLGNMWQTPVTDNEILFGAGCYFEPGHHYYYKRVDIGLLKNIFFWGVLGYIVIVIFQIIQLYPLVQKRTPLRDKLFFFSILIFLWILDFKAISLSLNKTAFSMIILLVLDYEKNFIHNTVSAIDFRRRGKLYSPTIGGSV